MDNSDSTDWITRYTPSTSMQWKGRKTSEASAYFHQLVDIIDLTKGIPKPPSTAFGIIGFCSDEGVRRNYGRPGAAKGPKCLREALAKLPYANDSQITLLDCGDIICTDSNLESSQKALGIVVNKLLLHNIHPVIFGGGHEVAWGTYQGIASAQPNSNIGIINFDAHYDLRSLVEGDKGSSGTPFYQIHLDRKSKDQAFNYLCIGVQRYGNTKELFNRATDLNVSTIYADEIYENPMSTHKDTIRTFLNKCDVIQLSLCLDVFSAAICPGVSAPQPLGIEPWHVIPMMREIIKSSKPVCMEIAELSPLHDINMRSARLGASLVCDYIHHILLTIN